MDSSHRSPPLPSALVPNPFAGLRNPWRNTVLFICLRVFWLLAIAGPPSSLSPMAAILDKEGGCWWGWGVGGSNPLKTMQDCKHYVKLEELTTLATWCLKKCAFFFRNYFKAWEMMGPDSAVSHFPKGVFIGHHRMDICKKSAHSSSSTPLDFKELNLIRMVDM